MMIDIAEKNRHPILSVITPVYNAEKYVENCVRSILAQEFADFELLLVNDGSTDASGNICERLAGEDSRIRVFHQKNMGPAAARNLALEQVKGQFVGFCDSDDMLNPHYYSVLMDNIRKHDADIVGVSFKSVDEQGIVTHNTHTNKVYVWNNEEAYREFLTRRCMDIHIWTKVYRRDFLDRNKIRFVYIKGHKLEEDFMFNLQVFRSARLVVYEDRDLYTYLKKDSSLSRDFLRNNLHNYLKYELYRTYLIERTTEQKYPQYLRYAKQQTIKYIVQMIANVAIYGIEDAEPYFSYMMRYLRRNRRQVISDRAEWGMSLLGVLGMTFIPNKLYYRLRRYKMLGRL